MNNQQWQEGKTYQFKPNMIEEFKELNFSNKRIAGLIGFDKFTVEVVGSQTGNVRSIKDFSLTKADVGYWFEPSEIKYFDLIEADTNNIRPDADIIVEWLEKLQYVVDNDNTVGYGLMLDSDDVIMLSTDFGDITGANSVCNFITNRYDVLQQEAKYKKNKELMERKAKLEAELVEVSKQLSEV